MITVYFVVGLLALEVLGKVAQIGKPREPITTNTACLTIVINAVIAYGLLTRF
jgi:hypothetical protein